MSLGTYCIPVDGHDDQAPHREDEIYVVLSGSGTLESDKEALAVRRGSVVFVPAWEPHRFARISEPMTVLVIFSPAYTGMAT